MHIYCGGKHNVLPLQKLSAALNRKMRGVAHFYREGSQKNGGHFHHHHTDMKNRPFRLKNL